MLACVGYLFTKLGFVFSGAIARDGTTFASIAEGAGTRSSPSPGPSASP